MYTARREAHEEVGLPASHPDIYTVAVLDPLLTVLPMGAHTRNHIVVTCEYGSHIHREAVARCHFS